VGAGMLRPRHRSAHATPAHHARAVDVSCALGAHPLRWPTTAVLGADAGGGARARPGPREEAARARLPAVTATAARVWARICGGVLLACMVALATAEILFRIALAPG